MTNEQPSGIGVRVASYRKWLGFKTAKDLADAIPNEKITASVIQNIESGRKADLSVAQLLDISKALGITPLALIVPIGKPYAKVDLPNVGDAVAAMTSIQVDRWFSESEPAESERALSVQTILRRVRDLTVDVAAFRRLDAIDTSSMTVESYTAVDDEGNEYETTHDFLRSHQLQMGQVAWSVAMNARVLSSFNVDLSWAEDVIERVKGAADG